MSYSKIVSPVARAKMCIYMNLPVITMDITSIPYSEC